MVNNNNKSKIIKYFAIILVLFIFSILISDFFAEARFMQGLSGIASAQIAEERYTTIVKPMEADEDEVNPYVLVTIKNNDETGVTDVSEEFNLEVASTDGDELPEYYWEDMDGQNLGVIAKGTFIHSDEQEKNFKLIFKNEANVDIERNIKIITTVNQTR